jgi:hypothetical protein
MVGPIRDLSGNTPLHFSFFAPNRVFATTASLFSSTPAYSGEIVLALDTGVRYRGLEITAGMWGNIWGTSAAGAGGTGLNNVVEDLSPQLGGDLDANGFNIFLDINNFIDWNVGDVTLRQSANTLTLETDGISRWDTNDSGFRLGGANARVTTILDDGLFAANSNTALATQQSIKTYVDSKQKATIAFIIDGLGSPITAGIKGDLRVGFPCTITKASLLASPIGSVVVDIWKDNYGAFPPTVADSITAAAKPTIVADDQYEDAVLTGWTTAILLGDTLRYNIDSASTVTKLTVLLDVQKG